MTCRVCGGWLKPLLAFDDMPATAQYLPEKPGASGVRLDVMECGGCGLVQLANEPVPYWREVIRAAGLSEEMKAFRREQFDYLGLSGKTVVEIGSGKGEYLSMLQKAGAQALGIAGLDGPWYVGDADAFAMFSVLEHMPEPVKALQAAAAMLKDDGVGIVEVPNFDMILRERLFAEFMTDHLMYFTAETLKRTLELSGLEVEKITPVWHDYMLCAEVRKRKTTDLSPLIEQQAKVRATVDGFVNGRRYAVWGAGHQALAAIKLLGLKPEYIVDSAPFKQGRYAGRMPIVEPARLKTDPVLRLIVMAASYSDEVARIVKRDYPHIRDVAILRPSGLESA